MLNKSFKYAGGVALSLLLSLNVMAADAPGEPGDAAPPAATTTAAAPEEVSDAPTVEDAPEAASTEAPAATATNPAALPDRTYAELFHAMKNPSSLVGARNNLRMFDAMCREAGLGDSFVALTDAQVETLYAHIKAKHDAVCGEGALLFATLLGGARGGVGLRMTPEALAALLGGAQPGAGDGSGEGDGPGSEDGPGCPIQ